MVDPSGKIVQARAMTGEKLAKLGVQTVGDLRARGQSD